MRVSWVATCESRFYVNRASKKCLRVGKLASLCACSRLHNHRAEQYCACPASRKVEPIYAKLVSLFRLHHFLANNIQQTIRDPNNKHWLANWLSGGFRCQSMLAFFAKHFGRSLVGCRHTFSIGQEDSSNYLCIYLTCKFPVARLASKPCHYISLSRSFYH